MPIAAAGASYLPQCPFQLNEERIQTLWQRNAARHLQVTTAVIGHGPLVERAQKVQVRLCFNLFIDFTYNTI